MANARTATASDFDKAAQRHAQAFWLLLVAAGVIWLLISWAWAVFPGAVAVLCALQSISATKAAHAMRSGSYRIPNPNVGAVDDDARNMAD